MSTKIHVAVDALGNPVKLMLSEGQKPDVTMAHKLISGLSFDVLLADKGYNSSQLENELCKKKGAEFCSPPKSNSLNPRFYNKELYKVRNLVERFFNLIKHFRKISTRYHKTNWFIYRSMILSQ